MTVRLRAPVATARCVADLVMADDATTALSIETDGAMLRAWRAGDGDIAVDMGPVATGWADVPLAHEADTLAVPLGIDGLDPAICHSLAIRMPWSLSRMPKRLILPP